MKREIQYVEVSIGVYVGIEMWHGLITVSSSIIVHLWIFTLDKSPRTTTPGFKTLCTCTLKQYIQSWHNGGITFPPGNSTFSAPQITALRETILPVDVTMNEAGSYSTVGQYIVAAPTRFLCFSCRNTKDHSNQAFHIQHKMCLIENSVIHCS